DVKAGHIPGAFNVPWRDFLTTDEGFVPVSRMADLLTGVDERSIVHCGSGVTGCVPLLAAEAAGLGTPRLYAGSWSDWITYPENPIEMGA
ncbi:MAG: sulfurtransferase, partial [Ignavibacteria bacterium]